MKQPTVLANDNDSKEDRVAAATMAMHRALAGLDAPAEALPKITRGPITTALQAAPNAISH